MIRDPRIAAKPRPVQRPAPAPVRGGAAGGGLFEARRRRGVRGAGRSRLSPEPYADVIARSEATKQSSGSRTPVLDCFTRPGRVRNDERSEDPAPSAP